MSFFTDLQSAIGDQFVSQDEQVVRVLPANTEEVSKVLRLCSEQNITVTPAGAGTKLPWGNPIRTGVRLESRRLCGIREHVWQDMTATVGAGTGWDTMQSALGEHGQQVALDPCFPAVATVGGTLAVNDSGALRVRYGSLRDLVIGMTIVLADGTIARSGGKVVKNVAGYDLPKLLIGSFGTLGVITEVNFRLHPVETRTQSWTICGDAPSLGKLMQKLRESATTLQALQIRSVRTDIMLDVRFASAPAALENDSKRLRAMCTGLEMSLANDEVWQWRNGLFEDPRAAVLKITCLPAHLEPIVSGFANASVQVRCAAEAVGVITAQLSGEPELMVLLMEDLRSRLRASGGMVVVLQWPYAVPLPDRWGGSPPAIAVMRELKEQFDPQHILNPGKFVGGI